MESLSSCPYATLGVDKTASQSEIKDAFRKLSKLTHPDVAAATASPERFKNISHAASILTNPKKRQIYDEAVKKVFRRNPYNNMKTGPSSSSHPYHRSAVASLLRPRNFILGPVALFASVSALQYMIGSSSNDRGNNGEHSQLVQAWLNPETRRYETPAPWDPVFQRLKPELEYVPRDQVHRGSR